MDSHPDAITSLEPLSAWRRQAWVAAVAPDEPHKLARRLAWDGLDAAHLEREWNAPGEDATARWPALQACREALQADWQHPLLPYDANDHRPFVDLWWPIRRLGVERLKRTLVALLR